MIISVQRLEGLLPNIWDGKKVHSLISSARFLTTFVDFDREYLLKGLKYRKPEKQMINKNPSHVGPFLANSDSLTRNTVTNRSTY